MGIGKTLSDILEENKSNPNELSERTGIPPSTIYSIIKRDNMKVDISVLARICKELGVSMSRFYDEYFKEKEQYNSSIMLNINEQTIIKKYRTLDEHGKQAIDNLLDLEYSRCAVSENKEKTVKVFKVARSSDGEKPQKVELTQEEYDRLLKAVEMDDNEF